MEEEPVHWDSKGVFVLATGGINSGGGCTGGGGGVHGGGEDITPMKCKGGRGEAADVCDAYDGRTEF